MNRCFEELGFKAGDTVRCIKTDNSVDYKCGDVFRLSNYRNSIVARINNVSFWVGDSGDWELVSSSETSSFETPDSDPLSGGPAAYYDLPKGVVTLNDLIEYKGDCGDWQGGDAFHLGNLMKALWRFGTKSGTTKAYDAEKCIYTGARLLKRHGGNERLRKTLQKVLDDPQFKE